MIGAENWFPMRWPPGWRDPSFLDLLKDTPINCLLIPAAEPDLSAVRQQARRVGFTCLSPASPEGSSGSLEQLPLIPRSALSWQAPPKVLAVSECVWPAIVAGTNALAGPTGVPWVDSNGWFCQLVRALAPTSTFWLAYEPPADKLLTPQSYALAAADAEAHGARWVISLDAATAAEVTYAKAALRAISQVLSFFSAHRAWRQFRPCAAVGVLSDFSGNNRELAEELLNLLSRRHLPFRVLPKSSQGEAPLNGLKAIVYPDASMPPAPLRNHLLDFVRAGGLLITGPQWELHEGSPGPEDVYRRFRVFNAGRGRLAIAKEELSDPYLLALDTHLLLGRAHDLIRLWNGGSLNVYYAASPDSKRALVQLINYATRRPAHPVTVGLARRYRQARWWEIGNEQPRALEIAPASQGIELPLPEFDICAAIELEA